MTPKVAIVVWLAGLAVWAIIRYLFRRKANNGPVSASFFGWRDKAALTLAWLGLLVCPGLWVLTGFLAPLDHRFSSELCWLGLATDCAALWLFYRSHNDLGLNWSVTLQIRQQHTLVKSGVYRLIRHPMYSSFFLLAIAQMLLLPNWFAGTAGLVSVSLLYAARVEREERMMLERFGDGYQTYMAATKRLIPWML